MLWWVLNLQADRNLQISAFQKCHTLSLTCLFIHILTKSNNSSLEGLHTVTLNTHVWHHLWRFKIVILGLQHRSSFRETLVNNDRWPMAMWLSHRCETCTCKLLRVLGDLLPFFYLVFIRNCGLWFLFMTLMFTISFSFRSKRICWVLNSDKHPFTCGHMCSLLLSVNM